MVRKANVLFESNTDTEIVMSYKPERSEFRYSSFKHNSEKASKSISSSVQKAFFLNRYAHLYIR
jgi:hypothetical protein